MNAIKKILIPALVLIAAVSCESGLFSDSGRKHETKEISVQNNLEFDVIVKHYALREGQTNLIMKNVTVPAGGTAVLFGPDETGADILNDYFLGCDPSRARVEIYNIDGTAVRTIKGDDADVDGTNPFAGIIRKNLSTQYDEHGLPVSVSSYDPGPWRDFISSSYDGKNLRNTTSYVYVIDEKILK